MDFALQLAIPGLIHPLVPSSTRGQLLFLPGFQNVKRRPFPKDTRNEDVDVEDRLDLHFARRLTLGISDFKLPS